MTIATLVLYSASRATEKLCPPLVLIPMHVSGFPSMRTFPWFVAFVIMALFETKIVLSTAAFDSADHTLTLDRLILPYFAGPEYRITILPRTRSTGTILVSPDAKSKPDATKSFPNTVIRLFPTYTETFLI